MLLQPQSLEFHVNATDSTIVKLCSQGPYHSLTYVIAQFDTHIEHSVPTGWRVETESLFFVHLQDKTRTFV